MSYSFGFVSNNVYGAKEVNDITKRLVSSGVEDMFEDGVPYNFSHLNTVSANISTLGVIPENNTSLKVTDNGKVNDEYTVTISDGTAFFEDGSTITIYDGGETLPYTYGQKNYVYVHRDLNLNKNMPKVTLTEPEGDYVPLAEISETGVVTDTRTFAKGKLPGYMSDYGTSKLIKASIEGKSVEVDLGGSNYKMMLINFYNPGYSDKIGNPITTILMVNGELVYNITFDSNEIRQSTDINNLMINWSDNTSSPTVYGSMTINKSTLSITLTQARTFDLNIYVA